MSKPNIPGTAPSCAFRFADGRRCRMLRSDRGTFCLHHERSVRSLRQRDQVAANVAELMEARIVSPSALNSSLARLFVNIADGAIPLKTAAQLISLSRVMTRTIPMATREFQFAFGTKNWDHYIREMYGSDDPPKKPAPNPQSKKPAEPKIETVRETEANVLQTLPNAAD